MNYSKIRKVPKLQSGAKLKAIEQYKVNHASELTGYENDDMIWGMIMSNPIDDSEEENLNFDYAAQNKFVQQEAEKNGINLSEAKSNLQNRGVIKEFNTLPEPESPKSGNGFGQALGTAALSGVSAMGGGRGAQAMASGIQMAADGVKGAGWGIGAGAAVGAMDMIDKAAMGDKNFSAQSQAIDTVVHTASSALLKSGNPYAMLAAGAIEAANFISKAGGQTVQGYDVDINNSGYGNLGHQASKSSRASLPGFKRHDMAGQLARRNEQARMALQAAAISEDQSFEQEARQNNITNVLMQNQQALAGGIELNELV